MRKVTSWLVVLQFLLAVALCPVAIGDQVIPRGSSVIPAGGSATPDVEYYVNSADSNLTNELLLNSANPLGVPKGGTGTNYGGGTVSGVHSTLTSNTILTASDASYIPLDTTGGFFDVKLPDATTCPNKVFVLQMIAVPAADTGTVEISVPAGQYVDEVNTKLLYITALYEKWAFISDGTIWHTLFTSTDKWNAQDTAVDIDLNNFAPAYFTGGGQFSNVWHIYGASATVTLLPARHFPGKPLIFQNATNHTVTINAYTGSPAETVDGAASYSLPSGKTVYLISVRGHTGSPSNWVSIGSDIARSYATFTTTGTINTALNTADATSGSFTLTLPLAADWARQCIEVKNIGFFGIVTIDGDGAETIDGALTYALSSQWQSVSLWSDGTQWLIK